LLSFFQRDRLCYGVVCQVGSFFFLNSLFPSFGVCGAERLKPRFGSASLAIHRISVRA
jgi:hypothetical protein